MAAKVPPEYFLRTSVFAFLSLWVLMTVNGVNFVLLEAAWSGVLPDGSKLKMDYLGLTLLDFPLRVLITFFYGLANRVQTVPYLLLVDLVTALWVINFHTLVESGRPTASKWLRSSAFWQYAWNCSGVALWLPIYAYVQFDDHGNDNCPCSDLPTTEAQALPFTAFWTLFLPVPLLVPGLIGTSPAQIQIGLAIYLLTPALCVNFHTMTKNLIADFSSSSSSRGIFFSKPVALSYHLLGTVSAVGHLGVLLCAVLTNEPGVSLLNMYVPRHSVVVSGDPGILTAGALLFSQWDWVVINMAVSLYGIKMLKAESLFDREISVFHSVLLVFGPGAGLAYAAIQREKAQAENVTEVNDMKLS